MLFISPIAKPHFSLLKVLRPILMSNNVFQLLIHMGNGGADCGLHEGCTLAWNCKGTDKQCGVAVLCMSPAFTKDQALPSNALPLAHELALGLDFSVVMF